ncbi:MAG: site-specific integrase [Clostridia bacterium]|nr:site-specific integrase [Clostridia bacterium]
MATIYNMKTKSGIKYDVVFDYSDEEGNRKQKRKRFSSKNEATAYKHTIESDKAKDEFITPKDMTVYEMFTKWISVYKNTHWQHSQYMNVLGIVNNYINPNIGDKQIQELKPYDIENFYDTLRKTKIRNPSKKAIENNNVRCLSPKSISYVHSVMKTAFSKAVEWQWLKYSPVICKPPKVRQKQKTIWTADMVRIALDNIDDSLLHLGLHLCFVCSLRPGEALGLTWDCVNFEEGYIRINKTLQRVPVKAIKDLPKDSIFSILPSKTQDAISKYILKIPKTETSNRKIFISEQLKNELKDRLKEINSLKKQYEEFYEDNNLVFALDDGSPIEVNLLNKWFKKWLKRSNLDFPEISIGNMRHSSLTYKLPLYNGDIKSLQGDSGHAQADVLLRVYAQKQDKHRKKLIKTFEDDFYSEKAKVPDSDELIDRLKSDPELRKKVLDALVAADSHFHGVI